MPALRSRFLVKAQKDKFHEEMIFVSNLTDETKNHFMASQEKLDVGLRRSLSSGLAHDRWLACAQERTMFLRMIMSGLQAHSISAIEARGTRKYWVKREGSL